MDLLQVAAVRILDGGVFRCLESATDNLPGLDEVAELALQPIGGEIIAGPDLFNCDGAGVGQEAAEDLSPRLFRLTV